jgi:hypothetical protein
MYPDFLVIGAQKAGTTWLDRNLRTHPAIWLPPEKEIHFFDLPRPFPFAALRWAPDRAVRHWARHRLCRDLGKVERGEQSADWYARYYHALRGWKWYRSLFAPQAGQICGEATPRYAVLPDWKIRSIRRHMPRLKIIYMLRDPLDRMWSDLAMFHDQRFGGKGTRHVGETGESGLLGARAALKHSRYAENIGRWQKYFPQEQFFIGFLEDAAAQPGELLARLFCFLGVDTSHKPPDDIAGRKINFAEYPAMPPETASRLSRVLVDDTRALHQKIGGSHTATWVARMEDPAGIGNRCLPHADA